MSVGTHSLPASLDDLLHASTSLFEKGSRYPRQTADIHRPYKRLLRPTVRGHADVEWFNRREPRGRRRGVQCQLAAIVPRGKQGSQEGHPDDHDAIGARLLHIRWRFLPGVPRDVYGGKSGVKIYTITCRYLSATPRYFCALSGAEHRGILLHLAPQIRGISPRMKGFKIT